MANFIIGGLIAAGAFLAARHTYRQMKNGECPGGCSGCSGCGGHCSSHVK